MSAFGRYRLLIVVILATLASALPVLGGPPPTHADIVTGEFSMEVTAPASAPLGSQFHVQLGVFHDGSTPAYQGVQWKLDYDQTLVTTSNADFTLAAGAPVECVIRADFADFLTAGCLDLSGNNSTYSGNAWDVKFTCNAAGTAFLNLVETTGASAKTFVKVGTLSYGIHTHDASTTCFVEIDSDSDGMPDSYEQQHPCLDQLVADGTLDPDVDGRTSLAELALGTDPCGGDTDADGDQMPDAYEAAHSCLNPLAADANADPDGDLISNLQEALAGSDPCVGVFNLEVEAPVRAELGSSFTVRVGVFRTSTTPNHQAVQWKLDYDQTVVTDTAAPCLGAACTTASLVTGAPSGECTAKADDGDRVLLGCISLAGPVITYSGSVWNIALTCSAVGPAFLNLVETTGPTPKTFVKIGVTAQPIHVLNAST